MTEHNCGLTRCPTCGHEAAAGEPSRSIPLLACPCCGGEAKLHDEVGPCDWMVACLGCDLNTAPCEDRAEAAAKWNRRVQAKEDCREDDDRMAGCREAEARS